MQHVYDLSSLEYKIFMTTFAILAIFPHTAISGCNVSSLPFSFKSLMTGPAEVETNQTLEATCRKGYAFSEERDDSGFYPLVPVVNLTCGEDEGWLKPDIFCSTGCNISELPERFRVVDVKLEQIIVSKWSRVAVECKRGKMLQSKRVIYKAEEICSSKGWEYPYIKCHEGGYLDILDATSPFILEGFGYILCKNNESFSEAILKFDNRTSTRKKYDAAMYVTSYYSYDNGKIASCELIPKNETQERVYKEIAIEIAFYPNYWESNTTFELHFGEEDRAVFIFQTNPPIQYEDINIHKEERNFRDFYLKIDGVKHEVVLHFEKVEKQDFGNYTIRPSTTVPRKYYSDKESVVIKMIRAPPRDLSVEAVTAITLGCVLFLVLVAFIWFAIKSNRNKKETN